MIPRINSNTLKPTRQAYCLPFILTKMRYEMDLYLTTRERDLLQDLILTKEIDISDLISKLEKKESKIFYAELLEVWRSIYRKIVQTY